MHIDDFARPLFLFSPDDGGAGGGSGEGGSGGSGSDAGDGGGGGAPQFTPPKDQAEFDRMLGERLARERAKYSDYDDLKARASKYDELEDTKKSTEQKLTEERDGHKVRGDTAEAELLRLTVGLDKAPDDMPLAQVRKLAGRLKGSTREELEADATELFAEYQPSGDGNDGGPARLPRERPAGGGAPSTETDQTDPRKLAEAHPRSGF